MTDFSTITACGECCIGCPKKLDGRCPGCIEADGRVPEWAESGRCKVHACARDHHVQFCGLCAEFPCAKLLSLISWNPDIVEKMTVLRNEYYLNRSIERMKDRIVSILDNNVHSVWLYGSIVLDDFRFGWSDIDILVLSNAQITEQQAQQLVELRQIMLKTEPDNPYYRSFEGVIADRNEYLAGSFSRLVYWGTSGQKITKHYQQDVFSSYELAKYGKAIYGNNDRSSFAEPFASELRAAVKQYYESIRQYAVQTDEKLYSCGWLLDIARCIYTLRYNSVIAKTQAGFWALKEHIFTDEEPLKKALEIRQNPTAYKEKEDVKQWLKGLGPVVQQYADVLERELRKAVNASITIKEMETDDEIRGKAY